MCVCFICWVHWLKLKLLKRRKKKKYDKENNKEKNINVTGYGTHKCKQTYLSRSSWRIVMVLL